MKAYKNAAIKGGKMVHLGTNVNLKIPSTLTSSFTVDTILGQLNWTDTNAGAAEYEVYSATNGGAETLLATTAAGATSYQDTTCKQNASVVYKIRAKKGSKFTDLVSATVLRTPLCFKTNQAVITPFIWNSINLEVGKSILCDWGDGTSISISGSNGNITKNYASIGQYVIALSSDINNITNLSHISQIKTIANITNWILPTTGVISLRETGITGNASSLIVPANTTIFYIYTSSVSGALPQIAAHVTNAMAYNASGCSFSDSNVTVFRKGMTVFNVGNQNVLFPTANIDKLLKALADWYEVNAPTANCTFTLSGANMGIPTGGASNADIARLIGYYTAAAKTATVIVRTS